MRDASYPQIQAALGQKTESMARRYVHLAAGAAKKYVEALPVLGKVVEFGDRQSVGSEGVTPAEDDQESTCETTVDAVS